MAGCCLFSLIATSGTMAAWNNNIDLNSSTITSGNLEASKSAVTWNDESIMVLGSRSTDINNHLFVPGDILVSSQNFDIALEGDNMSGQIEINFNGFSNIVGNLDYGLRVSYSLFDVKQNKFIVQDEFISNNVIVNDLTPDRLSSETLDNITDFIVTVRIELPSTLVDQSYASVVNTITAMLNDGNFVLRQDRGYLTENLVTGNVIGTGTTYWERVSSMPTRRNGLGVASDPNGRIYAIGGYLGGARDANERYNPELDSWSILPNMPTKRFHTSSVYSNNSILTLGGWNGSTYYDIVERYDINQNSWSTLASMNEAKRYFGVATDASENVFVFGGWRGGAGRSNMVEKYDAANNTWNIMSPMPVATERGVAVRGEDGMIYYFGGVTNSGTTNAVHKYNPLTNTWTANVTTMPVAKMYFAGNRGTNGEIILAGGRDSTGTRVGSAHAYNVLSDSWVTLPDMTTVRDGLGLGRDVNGEVYAIGGYGTDSRVRSVEKLIRE